MRRRVFVAGCLALGLDLGCSREPPRPRPEPIAISDLTTSFAGCAEFADDAVCELLEGGSLTYWARSGKGVLLAPKHAGLTITATRTVDGGTQWAFRLEADRGFVAIVELVDGRRFEHTLSVRRGKKAECTLAMPEFAGIDAAGAAALESRLRAAPAEMRPDCWRHAAIHARRAGVIPERTLQWMANAERAFRAGGRPIAAANSISTQAFFMIRDGRADDALRIMVQRTDSAAAVEVGLNLARLSTIGFAAIELGDLGRARTALEEALTWSHRLGDQGQWTWAARFLLHVRERVGDHRGAARLAAELSSRAATISNAGLRKGALATVHWWSLLARTRPFRSVDAPVSGSIETVDIARLRGQLESEGGGRILQVDVLTNLAIEAMLMHRFTAAKAYLDRAEGVQKAGGGTRRNRRWVTEARIQWALATRKPRSALKALDALERQGALSPRLAWMCAVHRVEAYRQLGDDQRARAAWQQAVRSVEQWPGAVAEDRSYGGLASGLNRSAQHHIGWLVDRRDLAGAIEVARWVRVREWLAARRIDRIDALTPDSRDRWQSLIARYQRLRTDLEAIPAPESVQEERRTAVIVERLTQRAQRTLQQARTILWRTTDSVRRPRPVEGELFFVVCAGRSRWLVLATDGTRYWSWPVAPLGADKASVQRGLQGAVDHLDEPLARSHTIRVMASGLGERVDIHRLLWRGEPLMRRKAVVYGLDVRSASTAGVESSPFRRALIVADPSHGATRLPFARQEAGHADHLLRSRGWQTTVLIDRMAERSSVVKALRHADLFHFAGHSGVRSRGLGAALLLAAAQTLTVRDILALDQAPQIAILSSCTSGREARDEALGPDLGLAQAFVLAGADLVVATSKPVDDQLSSRVGRALHDAGAYDGMTVARALGRLDASSSPDLGAFRIFVP